MTEPLLVTTDGKEPTMDELGFPLDVQAMRDFSGERGDVIADVESLSLEPPYPWGTWTMMDLADRAARGKPGDFAEFGVAKGGTSIALATIARQHRRRVHSFDSFEGLPAPDPVNDQPYFLAGFYNGRRGYGTLRERLESELRSRDLTDTVTVVQSFFGDLDESRLPEQLCFVHVDADLYGSVHDALELVWSRVVPGGVVVLDDIFHPAQGPIRALATFCNTRGLAPVLHVTFPFGVAIRKGDDDSGDAHRRCHDGFAYTLDLLRSDDRFVAAVRASARRGDDAAGVLAEALVREHDRADIYTYWYAMRGLLSRLDYRPGPDDELTI